MERTGDSRRPTGIKPSSSETGGTERRSESPITADSGAPPHGRQPIALSTISRRQHTPSADSSPTSGNTITKLNQALKDCHQLTDFTTLQLSPSQPNANLTKKILSNMDKSPFWKNVGNFFIKLFSFGFLSNGKPSPLGTATKAFLASALFLGSATFVGLYALGAFASTAFAAATPLGWFAFAAGLFILSVLLIYCAIKQYQQQERGYHRTLLNSALTELTSKPINLSDSQQQNITIPTAEGEKVITPALANKIQGIMERNLIITKIRELINTLEAQEDEQKEKPQLIAMRAREKEYYAQKLALEEEILDIWATSVK